MSAPGRPPGDTHPPDGAGDDSPPAPSAKGGVLRFVGGFAVGLAVLMGVSYLPSFEQGVLGPYLEWSASVGSWILAVLGFETSAEGRYISSPVFSIEIKRGCDAYEPIALYLAALLAFPAPWRRKLTGALWGIVILALLNFVRIVTLYWIGVRWPDVFEMFHVDVWQAAFIVLSLLLWMTWAWRVTKPAEAERAGA